MISLFRPNINVPELSKKKRKLSTQSGVFQVTKNQGTEQLLEDDDFMDVSGNGKSTTKRSASTLPTDNSPER